jgi:hypothetical protein
MPSPDAGEGIDGYPPANGCHRGALDPQPRQPRFPGLSGYGRRVGSLGPGLTSEAADAVRAVLQDDPSAGPQVYGTHRRCRPDLPVLCKRPGFTGPTASGCVPSLNLRKG